MSPLERQLSASLDYLRESRRQKSDLDEWLDAAPVPVPVPPKRLKRKPKMTVTAIERTNGETLVVHRDVSGPLEFTPQQCAMIRDTYANGASEKEFQVLMEIAKVRRLNPLLRQVHFVKRWDSQKGRDVWSVQVSVDGLRAIAERTGKYDGQDEPEYGYDKDGSITSCKVKVYRKDWSRPAVGIAHWTEYVQTKKDGSPTKFWSSMPHVMVAKCAEAVAMRKAFPEDMSGLYAEEEMMQADNDRPARLSPHVGPTDDADAAPADGGKLGAELLQKLEKVKAAFARCDTYDKVLALRSIIGTRAQQSELTRRLQAGKESGDISPGQAGEIDKLWHHCDRQLAKLESTLKPPAIEASFVDEPDGTEALGVERQPGEDSDEL